MFMNSQLHQRLQASVADIAVLDANTFVPSQQECQPERVPGLTHVCFGIAGHFG